MASTINASTSAGIIQSADTSGVLALQTGGTTGLTLNLTGSVAFGTSASSYGTSGQVLTSNGNAAPTWQAAFPSGGIIMWSGSIASIPSGWLLCDGTSGTPILRDRFIVGAGSTYAVAGTGGTADAVIVSHTHTATSTDSGHSHSGGFQPFSPGGQNASGAPNRVANVNTGTGVANITTTINSTGVSGTNANLPPYYALAYIMKS